MSSKTEKKLLYIFYLVFSSVKERYETLCKAYAAKYLI